MITRNTMIRLPLAVVPLTRSPIQFRALIYSTLSLAATFFCRRSAGVREYLEIPACFMQTCPFPTD